MEDDDYYMAFNIIVIFLVFVFLFYTIYDYRTYVYTCDHHCPNTTPMPTPAATPSPTATPAPTPGPTATPAPTPAATPVITAGVPTTWIDADGVDFDYRGNSIAFGNGKWIAVGFDSNATIKSSTNGSVWSDTSNIVPISQGEESSGAGLFGIATDGNGKWVAVGNQGLAENGKTIIFSSDNGVTWAASANGFNMSNGLSDRAWAVAYGNNVWMAVGHYTTSIGYERWVKVATTFNAVTGPNWVDKPAGDNEALVGFGLSNPAICVAYGDGRWCVGGQDMNEPAYGSIMYSNDNGTTWIKSTGSFDGSCNGIATDGNGNWVAVGISYQNNNTIKYSSNNGATWTDTTTSLANLFSYGNSVTYKPLQNGGIWIATGSGNSNTILYSLNNGLTWNQAGTNRFEEEGSCVYFSSDRWVAVGNGGSSSIKYSLFN
jgi:hypothetical protein